MSPFHRLLAQWVAWIVAASWQLALLVMLIATATWLLRAASPRMRHALWLLVLVKVFLPTSLTTPVSVGRWGVGPLFEAIGRGAWLANAPVRVPRSGEPNGAANGPASQRPAAQSPVTHSERSSPLLLFAVWAAGCLLLWTFVTGKYVRLIRTLRRLPTIDEGPLRVAVDRLALDFGVRRVPEIIATELVTSPFLIGVLRPKIVLPQRLLDQGSELDLRAVLAHELVHWRRGDTWFGWIQTAAQGVFWFHPFLWWANSQLRHERECACDEAVLRLEAIAPDEYGDAIVRTLTSMRGRSLVSGSLVGIFEAGTKLQQRLEEIMNYHPLKRTFGWPCRLAIIAAAVLLLPMSPRPDGRRAVADEDKSVPADNSKPKDRYPRIVKTTPPQGATKVDPALNEIAITFDRDMEAGMSWTGRPPLFPPLDKSRKARWTDKRTCVLPVKLEPGTFYRLGINSSSYQNFCGQDTRVPAASAVINFSTKGATEEVESRVRVPVVVSLDPPNGFDGVDPKTKSLRVTFSLPMGGGMSWTGEGPEFPKLPEGTTAEWSDDGLTCTLPVSLEGDHDYQLGLNSVNHNNFQSRWGVPVEAVVYKFHTRAAAK